MVKRKKKASTPQSELFEVEALLKARVAGNRGRRYSKTQPVRWEYLVKWKNYDSDENSWEPEEGVKRCERLLAEFWEAIDTDNEDYQVGDEVKPSNEWMGKNKTAQNTGIARETVEDFSADLALENSITQPRLASSSTPPPRNAATKSTDNYNYGHGKRLFIRLPSRFPSRDKTVEISESSDDDIPLDELKSPLKKIKTDASNHSVMAEPQHEMAQNDEESLFSEPSSPGGSPTPSLSYLPPLSSPPIQPSAKATMPANDPRRRVDPHVRITGTTSGSNTSAPGIPTKQRLAQGALAPRKPKSISLFIPKPRPRAQDMRQDGHSMPHGSLPTYARHSERQDLTLSEMNAGARTPCPDDLEAPPSSQDHDMPIDYMEPPLSKQFKPVMLSPSISWPVESIFMAQEATQLDSTFPILSSPSSPVAEDPRRSIYSLVPSQHPPHGRTTHDWTMWSGPVRLSTSKDVSKHIFNGTICDVSAPPSQGLHLGTTLSLLPHLEFSKFYDLVDLGPVLRACRLVQQFARLVPQSDTDAEPLQTLVNYMTRKEQIFLLPVVFDENVEVIAPIAYIILFPPGVKTLTSHLKTPLNIQKDGSLLAALVTWSLSQEQQIKDWRKPPDRYLPSTYAIAFSDMERWDQSILTNPLYHHGLCVLDFPRELIKFMSEHNRGYCVWHDGGDGSKRRPGVETRLLHSIMGQCRAKKPANVAEVRVVFVHVGAVKSLHRLPGFVEFTSKLFHVQFYTYGTHETIAPEYWGVHEIYPCGGVVTFTPKAIINDPVGVLHRVSQIHSHPLWASYLLPSVLGMVTKLRTVSECDDLGVSQFGRDIFPYPDLLSAIDNGEIALLTAPHRLTKSKDPRGEWIFDYFTHRPQNVHSMLQSSLDAFNTQYQNTQAVEVDLLIRAEISNDLASMRQQPSIMVKYRRYIIIDYNSATSIQANISDGLEYTSIDGFDFKDDFFPKN